MSPKKVTREDTYIGTKMAAPSQKIANHNPFVASSIRGGKIEMIFWM